MAFVFVFLTLVLYIVPHNIIGMQQLALGSKGDTIKKPSNKNDDQGTSGNNSEDKEKNKIGTSGNNSEDKEKNGGLETNNISTSSNNGFSGNNDVDDKD